MFPAVTVSEGRFRFYCEACDHSWYVRDTVVSEADLACPCCTIPVREPCDFFVDGLDPDEDETNP